MTAAYKSYWHPPQQGDRNKPDSLDKNSDTSGYDSGSVGSRSDIIGSHSACLGGNNTEDGAALVGQTVKLSEGESRHLVKVFRARAGDAVTLFDARGNVWHGALAGVDGRAAQVRIERHESLEVPRPCITLGQALPKGKTMDSVIAAMVELGVARITPLATDHSEVRIEKDAARAQSKREHWQQTAIEAAKQSSNFYGTQIESITSLKIFLDALPACGKTIAGQGSAADHAATATAAATAAAADHASAATAHAAPPAARAAAAHATPSATSAAAITASAASQLRIIGSLEDGSVPLAALAGQIAAATEVICLIGPEGDFSPAEYALARAHGFVPVRLAAHVLRVKTAATYIVSTVDALARAASLPL